MVTVGNPPSRLGRATLGSLGLHFLVALGIPALAWTATSAPPVETISFMRIEHIVIEPHHTQPQPQAAAPQLAPAPKITLARNDLSRLTARKTASPPPQRVARSSAPTVAAYTVAGNGVKPGGEAAPQVSAPPADREVASVGTHDTGGYLPFGAEQPDPVLNPAVLKQLDALGVHVTLVVTVGEDGKTKNVAFEPTIEPSMASRIESLLADASWDPATCGGGVSCEGRATIHL